MVGSTSEEEKEKQKTGPISDYDHRRILFFPYGNGTEHASLYLEHGRESDIPENWYACVQFALVLSNVKDPSIYHTHGNDTLFPGALSRKLPRLTR